MSQAGKGVLSKRALFYIRAELERKGTLIGPMDLLIAGHARSEGLVLVTNNTREFCRVERLVVEDWTKEQAGEMST